MYFKHYHICKKKKRIAFKFNSFAQELCELQFQKNTDQGSAVQNLRRINYESDIPTLATKIQHKLLTNLVRNHLFEINYEVIEIKMFTSFLQVMGMTN
jgi:hypothetical protein